MYSLMLDISCKVQITRVQSTDPKKLSNKEGPGEACLNFTEYEKNRIDIWGGLREGTG